MTYADFEKVIGAIRPIIVIKGYRFYRIHAKSTEFPYEVIDIVTRQKWNCC